MNLIANNGDIRGDGTLDVAGNIFIQAGQIYPTTETTFTIAAYNYTDAGGNGRRLCDHRRLRREKPSILRGRDARYLCLDDQSGRRLARSRSVRSISGGTASKPARRTRLTKPDSQPADGADRAEYQFEERASRPFRPLIPSQGRGSSSLTAASIKTEVRGSIQVASISRPAEFPRSRSPSVAITSPSPLEPRRHTRRGRSLCLPVVSGVGGIQDILASNGSYAVIPGYQALFAPDEAYNIAQSTTTTANPYNPAGTVADFGYFNPALQIGSQVC